MLSARCSDEFQLVCTNEPALIALPTDMVTNWYMKGRNIEDLDLKKCEVPVTIFSCEPLQTEYEYLIDKIKEGVASASWLIFKFHVKSAVNFSDEHGKPLLEWDDEKNPSVKSECRNRIPMDVYMDIAAGIVNRAKEVSQGFTLPDTFLETRRVSQFLHASTAVARSAKKDPSKSESNPSPQDQPATESSSDE